MDVKMKMSSYFILCILRFQETSLLPTFKWINVKLMSYLFAQLIQLVYMQ